MQVIIKAPKTFGFYWVSSGRLTLRDGSAIEYQDVGGGRTVAFWEGTVFPGSWIGLWFNDDADSGSTTQPVGAPLEWFVREQAGDEDTTQVVPTHPPYHARTTRDVYDVEDVKYYDKPQPLPPTTEPLVQYVGPATANYRVTALSSDQYFYSLYHELLNRYPYNNISRVWVLNQNPKGNGATLYQESPNGNGWLDLSRDVPAWDAGAWHLVYFTAVNSRWAIGDGKGRFLTWSPQSVGAYDGAISSFATGFTTNLSAALQFDFTVSK